MSNIDLQQYNGSASFPATGNVGTNADPLLLPTDGPLVTADSNAVLQAPVNISLKRFKDLLLGLRGATIGDFAGAAIKTFKSLMVDGTGGAASAAPAGSIIASGDITGANIFWGAITGVAAGGQALLDSLVRVGAAGAERTQLAFSSLAWLMTSTGASGSNPPQGTSIKNELRAINVPKASAYVNMSAANTISSFDGYGIQTVAINGTPTVMDITFKDAFANTNYVFETSTVGSAGVTYVIAEIIASRTTTSTQISAVAINGMGAGTPLDFSATALSFSLAFTGQQNT